MTWDGDKVDMSWVNLNTSELAAVEAVLIVNARIHMHYNVETTGAEFRVAARLLPEFARLARFTDIIGLPVRFAEQPPPEPLDWLLWCRFVAPPDELLWSVGRTTRAGPRVWPGPTACAFDQDYGVFNAARLDYPVRMFHVAPDATLGP
jgi:hypothetical protein